MLSCSTVPCITICFIRHRHAEIFSAVLHLHHPLLPARGLVNCLMNFSHPPLLPFHSETHTSGEERADGKTLQYCISCAVFFFLCVALVCVSVLPWHRGGSEIGMLCIGGHTSSLQLFPPPQPRAATQGQTHNPLN